MSALPTPAAAAGTPLDGATQPPGAASARPPARRGAPAFRRPGLLGGIAAIGAIGAGAYALVPTRAELLRSLLAEAASPMAADMAAQPPRSSHVAASPAPEAVQVPATAVASAPAGPVLPASARQEASDPWAELRSLVAEAAAPAARGEIRASGDERAERERLAAALRDLGLLVRQGLEGQIQLRKEIARLEAENRAVAEGVQSRLDTLHMRVAFAADARSPASASGAAPPVAAPVPTAAASAAPAQPARTPWQNPGHVPARSLRSPAAGYQVGDASTDMALLLAPKPAPGQPSSVVVKVGTEVPGLGKVTRIERRTTGWEVHTERGIVTE